ncbi:MAG: peroxiredoxin-like family protein [bacterium]
MGKQTLAQQLEELVNSSLINEQQLDVLLAGFRRLAGSGILDSALREGALAPDFSLLDQQGQAQSLHAHLEHGPLLLQFFRGDWCPFCQAQLRALSASRDEISALGASILCLSPETPEKHARMAAEHGLKLSLLSDPGGLTAHAWGVAYDLTAAELELYRELGIEPTQSAQSSTEFLPVPASYIILPGARIAWRFIDPDWRRRSEPADMLSALRAITAGAQG